MYFTENLTYSQIAVRYGVSIPTIFKWFKGHGINARKKFEIVKIGEVEHKRCFGPGHPPAGELLPLSKFHKNPGKRGGVQARCIACLGKKQRVNFRRYAPWVESIYRRLGYSETVRRLEIDDRTLTIWLGKDKERGKPLTIRQESAVKIVKLMAELRASGEVRHRKSIKRGAKLRGEPERPVQSPHDFLIRHGNSDAETRRRWRESLTPEQREEITKRDSQKRRERRLRNSEAA